MVGQYEWTWGQLSETACALESDEKESFSYAKE